MSYISKIIKNPWKIANIILCTPVSHILSDRAFLKIKFRATLGQKLNLKNPKTFNEKIQWLKLNDRKPVYTTMVDKYEAKRYVAERIGEEYIIPTLSVWDKFEDIDFDALPNQFVLKCTHDSGGLVICRNKAELDIESAKRKINKCLKKNYYWVGREWPYKNVKPRIIAEKYMVDESGYELKDYKIFAFNGFAKAMFIATDRANQHEETKFDFYDMDFNHLPFTNGHPNASHEIKRPDSFEKMKKLSEILSKDIPHVRVDFYDINGQVYFGELTFSHWSGMVPFEPKEWDDQFGEWIEIPDTFGGGYLIVNKGYMIWLHEKKEYNDLKDYKIYCFDGKVKQIMVASGRFSDGQTHFDYFNEYYERLPVVWGNPISDIPPQKPKSFETIVRLAEKLSQNMRHIRVDFYESDSKVYFGELTFYDGSGFEEILPHEWDEELGKWIKVPELFGGVSDNK